MFKSFISKAGEMISNVKIKLGFNPADKLTWQQCNRGVAHCMEKFVDAVTTFTDEEHKVRKEWYRRMNEAFPEYASSTPARFRSTPESTTSSGEEEEKASEEASDEEPAGEVMYVLQPRDILLVVTRWFHEHMVEIVIQADHDSAICPEKTAVGYTRGKSINLENVVCKNLLIVGSDVHIRNLITNGVVIIVADHVSVDNFWGNQIITLDGTSVIIDGQEIRKSTELTIPVFDILKEIFRDQYRKFLNEEQVRELLFEEAPAPTPEAEWVVPQLVNTTGATQTAPVVPEDSATTAPAGIPLMPVIPQIPESAEIPDTRHPCRVSNKFGICQNSTRDQLAYALSEVGLNDGGNKSDMVRRIRTLKDKSKQEQILSLLEMLHQGSSQTTQA